MPIPFDDSEDRPSDQSQKIGLKQVSSQKSIFDSMPKKPNQDDLEERVKTKTARYSQYKERAAELTLRFNKMIVDKTLPQNKSTFQQEIELDCLKDMVKLAQAINNDPLESEGEGSLSWVGVLLKTCLAQRDRINKLEYMFVQLENKADLIKKEILDRLDKPQKSE